MYALDDYDYQLPPSLIAQRPLARRDGSRLLHLDRGRRCLTHRHFSDLPDLLRPGDLLVVNNTRVIPARLLGRKDSGGKVEVLILDYAGAAASQPSVTLKCLVKASKRPKPGSRLIFGQGMTAVVVADAGGICALRFATAEPFETALEKAGCLPLPPYIHRPADPVDAGTYQTVYASAKGAVAAPTAGLHFTEDLLERLRARGVTLARITLHVGYGTFLPVRVDDIREHRIHSEAFVIDATAAEAVNRTRAKGGRVVAVGTTVVRTLEFAADPAGMVQAGAGDCDLYIYPGYRFKVIDALVTNFHLPRSTLLMLVSAFAGREAILSAYREAVDMGYRFFSYGDAMLIE